MKKRLLPGFCLIALIALGFSYPKTPGGPSIVFEGQAWDAEGQPLIGEHTLVFSLFETSWPDEPLWTEEHEVIIRDDGRYAVGLGRTTGVMPQFGRPYVLQVQVKDTEELKYESRVVLTAEETPPRRGRASGGKLLYRLDILAAEPGTEEEPDETLPVATIGRVMVSPPERRPHSGGGGLYPDLDPNIPGGGGGDFLPLSGGEMKGGIVAGDSDPAITIPTYPDANTLYPSIKFNTQGQEPAPWRMFVDNGATNNHDHVFMTTYNGKRSINGGTVKDDPNGHYVVIQYESRWAGTDPNYRGLFEWNVNIDPNQGPMGTTFRPFFFYYSMDHPFLTGFMLGDPANNSQDMRMEFNVGGKCAWCFWNNGTGSTAKAEFGDQTQMGGVFDTITAQGRIVLDPGGDAFYGTDPNSDHAVIIGNLGDGDLRLEPGLDPNGVVKHIFLSDSRAADVRVGSEFDDARFSINGARDQTQLSIRGNSTQNTPLVYVATNSRHVFDIKPFGIIAVGDDNWGGLLSVDGYQNQVQFHVRGHSTQSSAIANIERDDGTDILNVYNGGTIRLEPMATAPESCAQGEIYMDTSGAYCVCTSTNNWTNTTGIGACT